MFLLEKAHLKPVSPLKSKEISFDASITAKIGKYNTIRFKGKRYSVPLGTYHTVGSNEVILSVRDQELMILNDLSGEEITRHSVSLERGKLIKKRNHGRDRSNTIQKYREAMIHLFEDERRAAFFIDKVIASHNRYARDQFFVLEKAVQDFPKIRETTLENVLQKNYGVRMISEMSRHT